MFKKLAIEGGEPVRKDPFPPRIQFGEEELEVVTEIIKESMKGNEKLRRYSGPHVEKFEEEFAQYHGAKYGVASTSGTAAVHLAVAALDLEPGSEVITTPITDQGTVIPILYQNLIPIFADIDPETFNISPNSIEERITNKTKAIIVVHLAGQPADMDPIMKIAKKYNLWVIEDASQAHGAEYKGRKVGSIGDIGCFSLMSGKHITSGGEGGMTITNNSKFREKMRSFADKGRAFPDRTNFMFLGMNYRMTEIQAAIGRIQLKKLPQIIATRKMLCENLRDSMSSLRTIKFWKIIDDVKPTYWFCFFKLNLNSLKVNKEKIVEALNMEGIPVASHYFDVMYKQPWIKNRKTYGRSQCPWSCPLYGKKISYINTCPNAEKAVKEHMTLMLHESCTQREVEDTVKALEKVENHYLK